jgi:hypothetical protein
MVRREQKLAISSSKCTQLQSDFAPGTPLPFIYETTSMRRNPSVMPAVNDPFLPDLAAFAALSPCSHKANLPALLKAAGCSRGVLGDSFFS